MGWTPRGYNKAGFCSWVVFSMVEHTKNTHSSGELISWTSGFPLFQMKIRNYHCQISNLFVALLAFTVVNLHLVQKVVVSSKAEVILVNNQLLIQLMLGLYFFNCYLEDSITEIFRKQISYPIMSYFQECCGAELKSCWNLACWDPMQVVYVYCVRLIEHIYGKKHTCIYQFLKHCPWIHELIQVCRWYL